MTWLTQKSPWYICRSGKMHGPFSPRGLLQRAVARKLRPRDLVWTIGFPDWRAARDVEGLFAPPSLPHEPLMITFEPMVARSASESELAAGEADEEERQAEETIESASRTFPVPAARSGEDDFDTPLELSDDEDYLQENIDLETPQSVIQIRKDLSRMIHGSANKNIVLDNLEVNFEPESAATREAGYGNEEHEVADDVATAPSPDIAAQRQAGRALKRRHRRRLNPIMAGLLLFVPSAAIGVAFSLGWNASLGDLDISFTTSQLIERSGTWLIEKSKGWTAKPETGSTRQIGQGLPPDVQRDLAASRRVGGLAASQAADSNLALNSEAVWNSVHPSMVRILAFGDDHIPRRLGMGFYFKENLVATNLHVVASAKSLALQNFERRDVTRDVRIKAISRDLNIAIIETGRSAKPLSLSGLGLQKVGDPVLVFGDPKWSVHTTVVGAISGVRSHGATNIFEISATLSPGKSGGPVFDKRGNVLGIATFEIGGSRSRNVATSVAILKELAERDSTSEPDANVDTGFDIQKAVIVQNYQKSEGESSEEITFKNVTNDWIENVIFAVAYRDAKGNIINARILRMEGPISPGDDHMVYYTPPKLIWNLSYNKFNQVFGKTYRAEIWPLDFEFTTNRNPS